MSSVLIADDDKLSRRLLQTTLEKGGYEVVVVEDGVSAVRVLCQQNGPRLALLDWMMPGLDGVSVVRDIRARCDLPYIHMILLTSRQCKDDVITGLEAGADDYLTKPFHPPELRARLRTGERILLLEDKLVEAREEMRFKATHDSLTELWNRAMILDFIQREITRSSRERSRGMTVVLGDVDHFKQINDTYGHAAGDAVLRGVARRLNASIRGYDGIGRYGGEEFLIVLIACPGHLALGRIERIRQVVEAKPFKIDSGGLSVTMSFGVASTDDWSGRSSEQLIHEADMALYRAKESGRNRTVLARPSGMEEGGARRSESPVPTA